LKLKLKDISPVYSAFCALDGIRTLANDGKTLVLVPYEFSAKTSWNLRKNLGIFRRKVDTINEHKDALKKKLWKDVEKPTPEETALAQKEWSATLEVEEEIEGVLRLKEADFNLYDKQANPTGNKIPGTVLDQLEAVIEGQAGKEETATPAKPA